MLVWGCRSLGLPSLVRNPILFACIPCIFCPRMVLVQIAVVVVKDFLDFWDLFDACDGCGCNDTVDDVIPGRSKSAIAGGGFLVKVELFLMRGWVSSQST